MVEQETDQKVMLLSRQKNYENLLEEQKNLSSYREDLQKQRDIFVEQGELDAKSWAIAKEHFTVLKPTWEYENIPEYMDLVKQAKENDFILRQIQHKQQLKQLEANIASVSEQIQSLALDADRIGKELEIYGNGKQE